jgi:DNA-binding NtrC family response regulator
VRRSETPTPVAVVVIDDEEDILSLIEEALKPLDARVFTSSEPQAGLELIQKNRPRLVFLDLNLRQQTGLTMIEQILEIDPAIEVILISGDYSTASAVEAIQRGAADYLTKPLSLTGLRERVQHSINEVRKNRETFQLDGELLSSFNFHGIVGRSPRMLDLFNKMRRVAPHFRTVLVGGPSGTGKELVARALHELSPAVEGPFVVCNCAGLPETLAESELFGYVKGAFTGAVQDKLGFFEHANGGTLFLDEIGEMPLSMQAKLLRVLQTYEIQRVGSPAIRKLDVRVVAATNRDLRTEVREGRFREDLYYRLSSVHLELPSLSERKEDLPLLQRHFVEKFAAQYRKKVSGLSRRAQNLFSRYRWPGNIRELENVIGNACMMADGPMIDAFHLPEWLQTQDLDKVEPTFLSLKEVQQKHVERVLEMVGGNKLRAAEILGISRSTLYSMIAEAEEVQHERQSVSNL